MSRSSRPDVDTMARRVPARFRERFVEEWSANLDGADSLGIGRDEVLDAAGRQVGRLRRRHVGDLLTGRTGWWPLLVLVPAAVCWLEQLARWAFTLLVGPLGRVHAVDGGYEYTIPDWLVHFGVPTLLSVPVIIIALLVVPWQRHPLATRISGVLVLLAVLEYVHPGPMAPVLRMHQVTLWPNEFMFRAWPLQAGISAAFSLVPPLALTFLCIQVVREHRWAAVTG